MWRMLGGESGPSATSSDANSRHRSVIRMKQRWSMEDVNDANSSTIHKSEHLVLIEFYFFVLDNVKG